MTEQFVPKVVPYIPRLEGIYQQRFYALVSSWRDSDQNAQVMALENEIVHVTQSRPPKLTEQYNRYRAVLLLLRDLLTTTWAANFEYGQLMLNTFSASNAQGADSGAVAQNAKVKLQRCMESSRLRIIEDNRDFILKVEQGTWAQQRAPISALMTDGKMLSEKLRDVINGKIEIKAVIDPELQLVDAGRDEKTGLRLLDIWRYFRYTWSSPAENTPGRSMQYLIRNRALSGRPIMGISSLDNCALAMGPRDKYLGWAVDSFIDRLKDKGWSAARILKQVDSYLSDGISSINTKGLRLTARQLESPTSKFIEELKSSAQEEKDSRRKSLAESSFKANSDESKKLLFLKKRKEKLASFLDARRQINELVEQKGGYRKVVFADLKSVYPALTIALQAQKEKHIGSSLLELNVCGAIRPYNELLAGKLIALSALTPYVLDTYRQRYKDRPSEIASQMLGEDVVRSPDLVYVGTTSLYSVGSSQYNRLVVPKARIGSSFDLRYSELDERTQGFGTFHISHQTIEAIEEVLKKEGSQTVNHQFGEGASPKLRLLGEGVRALLKSDGNNSLGAFTSHAMPRIIYAAPLISNLFEYLLGLDKKPKYYEARGLGDAGTQQILDFWTERWLLRRLDYAPALERVAEFDLSDDQNRFMVGKFLSALDKEGEVRMEDERFEKLVSDATTGSDRIAFLRKFYRNGSAFADSTEMKDLESIHVKTKLDDAILAVVRTGKDCVLTGNPGDGKTHVLRMLENALKTINRKIEPVYDASALTTGEIIAKWEEAKKKKIPFVIAINASILYELAQIDDLDLPEIREAYEQFESGVVSGDVPNFDGHGVVVFNLGLRSALDPSVVSGVIDQMANSQNFKECKKCPFRKECGFRRHAEIVKSSRFRDRIQKIFRRVELVGWHVTIRDVQAFFSYLIFWNHSCENIVAESEGDQYRIENLIYKEGGGNLFKAIRAVFDPARISMPELDEKLVVGDYQENAWTPGAEEPTSAVDVSSSVEFNRRKRAFYFFHEDGDRLLESRTRGSVAEFERFLNLSEKKQRKAILAGLRSFVGDRGSSDLGEVFPVWRGFRFDNSPRRLIVSSGGIQIGRFSIVKPNLLPSMEQGFAASINYVLLRENQSGKTLKIDFPMFKLFECSEQKVPVWALEENNNAKKIWRFMEALDSLSDPDDDEKRITLYDLQRNEKIMVEVDTSDHRYLNISRRAGL